eukprot:CAMPEP_0169123050 /NCGR_PEP_ID=MMETSP1015-20121227/33578_1 /TAXON_ID=342587 /ORGANISM="Karlodinium micrum, Strain CCMP2283" /LENGTH=95 /DNA_ID=CAMNT_0009186361 /DNA_START=103 /DNA_END=387 /DNA_ORIENTATION=+
MPESQSRLIARAQASQQLSSPTRFAKRTSSALDALFSLSFNRGVSSGWSSTVASASDNCKDAALLNDNLAAASLHSKMSSSSSSVAIPCRTQKIW